MREEFVRLYQQVGNPSLASLEKHAALTGHRVSKATFGNLLNGRGRPRLDTVEAFVTACASYARSRRPPLKLSPEAFDLDDWRSRYVAAYPSTAATVDTAFAAARRDYFARLHERYQRVDLEVLTPLTDHHEHPPVGLRQVFVPQAVRADPPPVELPRELWRRLVEAGGLDKGDLPEGMDPKVLATIRQAYQDRPPRSVLQVVAEPEQQRLVLLGDPGAGKSTLASYIALTLAGAFTDRTLIGLAGWLPLLVELRTYADVRWRDRTFLDLIDHLHATEGLGLPKPMLEDFLRRDGRAVMIFDGLDELFDPQLRETVARQIAGLTARYFRARIVVTSRIIGYRRSVLDMAGFAHYMLQDLDAAQITAFVTRWYEIAYPHTSTEATRLRRRLLAAVDHSAAVRELAGNPMLLTILAIIGRRRELPRDRRAVYQHAVSVLVEQWDPSKHLRDTRPHRDTPYLDYEDKLELLRLVASRMQDRPAGLAGNHIPGSELVAEFDNYLRQRYELLPDRAKLAAKAMIEQFRERNFILSRFGAEVYGFVHRAFLEYLAADDIVQRFKERELTEDELITGAFGRHWSDSAWQEVLLLITGMIPERFAGQVIDYLLTADPLWFLRPNKLPQHELLAVRCIGEIRKLAILYPQSLAIIDKVISMLETAYEQDRFESSLTQALEQTVLPVLTALRPHRVGRERYLHWYLMCGQFMSKPRPSAKSVISLAARIGAILLADNRKFRELLQNQATLSSDWDIRQAAIQALGAGWAGFPNIGVLLRERATSDPSPHVRRAALQGLAEHWRGDPDTGPLLRERATTDQQWRLRHTAIQALATGWAEDPNTGPLLRDRATTDPDPDVRQTAIQALGTGWTEDPNTGPLLRDRATTDPDPDVRQTAIQALGTGWTEDPNTGPLLRERATTDQHWPVRHAALRALATGWAEDSDIGPLLRERAIFDPDQSVRRFGVQTLAERWRDNSDIGPLLRERATTDPDPYVRQAAIQALGTGWAEDPNTGPLLRERATTDHARNVRRAALQSLAEHWRDDPDTGPLLRERATTDRHGDVRQTAIRALATGWAEDPDTGRVLRQCATTDPDREVGRAALEARDVRRAALETLAEHWRDDPDTGPLLRERATTDPDWDVRRAAALQSLTGRRRDDSDIGLLLREYAATDPDLNIGQAAIQALVTGWAESPDIGSLLRQCATTDPYWEVRRAAVRGLNVRWINNPDTGALLRKCAIADRHEEVRTAAVQALAARATEDPDAGALLRDCATSDSHWVVRRAAVWALAAGWRDDPATSMWLSEFATTDPDWAIRQAAMWALADRPGGHRL